MKKILILCALIGSMISAKAQTVIDNFIVGPYIVDYNGDGEVKYRLRDNIDLYEYFELSKDTTIVAATIPVTPFEHGIQVNGYVGANRHASKELGVSGLWKQKIGNNLYFNGGVSIALGHAKFLIYQRRNMFEAAIPLQIELGKLNHEQGTLYGVFGIAPTVYATMSAETWNGNDFVDGGKKFKKSGFLIAPELEFGGNIPVGNIIMRIGVYGKWKINCSVGDYDVYRHCAGRVFFGAKIGVVL